MKQKKCKCCKKPLKETFGGQKYCSSCSLYTLKLRQKISYFKGDVKRLKKIIYGQERGTERLR